MTPAKQRKAKKKLNEDPIFKAAMKKIRPIDLLPSGNVFNELVKNIVYQQISYKAAETIYGRFEKLVGTGYLPADLLVYAPEDFRAVGFSNRKATYVLNIAQYFKDNDLYDCDWSQLSDEEIITTLSNIKGVGEWTAQMILIFELHRPDVLPTKDLAIQQVMQELYGIKEVKKDLLKKMVELAEPWRPYRTLATLYLYGWKRASREKAKLLK